MKSSASPPPATDRAFRCLGVLGMGGTIAGRAAAAGDDLGYVAGEVPVQDLLQAVPVPDGFRVACEQVAQIDSKDMSDALWHRLAARCAEWLGRPEVAGLVVTHGTDTLEETAFFLQSVLAPRKPVVLTCAMRPASSLAPDGPGNVRDALVVAGSPGASGVVVVCAGRVHSAFDVRKTHTYRLDAFGSGEAGPVACVEDGALQRWRDWPISEPALAGELPDPAVHPWPHVEIVMSHAGVQAAWLDWLVEQRRLPAGPRVEGVVLAATGNGTLHQTIEAAARRAQAAGVAVVRATRCAEGRVLSHAEGEFPHAGGLSPVQARIALMLRLLAQRRPGGG